MEILLPLNLSSKILIRGLLSVANSRIFEEGNKNKIILLHIDYRMLLGITISYIKTTGKRRN